MAGIVVGEESDRAIIAEDLSRVLDRRVKFVPVTDEAAHQGMIEAGLPEAIAEPLVALFRLLRKGLNSTTTDAMRHLTGRRRGPSGSSYKST